MAVTATRSRRAPRATPAAPTTPYRVAVFPSAIGWISAVLSGTPTRPCIHQLSMGHDSPTAARRALDPRLTRDAPTSAGDDFLHQAIEQYLSGRPARLNQIPYAPFAGSPFARRVLEACRRIPYGQTRSYAQLAAAAGSPGAARAVGRVMAGNRVPLVIPCHRVVGSAGKLGGFSAPGGLETKQRLLDLEARCRPRGDGSSQPLASTRHL
ncbi:MAG: methylated-DNA--[protein]-cysteine S-methyltransferase [Pirellulales bacterium]|nr:methylated-DNA--[protein]-cysteine S-methyltransferase [Pirellulales bacterium]